MSESAALLAAPDVRATTLAPGDVLDADDANDARGVYCLPCRGPLAREWRRVIDLAVPLIIGYTAVNAMLTEDLAFVGQIGKVDLASMNLANAILFATLIMPVGLTNSVRVLAAQSYGAGQAKTVGTWMQVALVWTLLLFALPISLVWWFAGDIVCALGLEHEEVAEFSPVDPMASLFVRNFTGSPANAALAPSVMAPAPAHGPPLPGGLLCDKASEFARLSLLWLWPTVLYNILGSALEAVEVVLPVTIISVVFAGVNFGINAFFISYMRLGLVGSALATFVSKMLQLVTLLIVGLGYLRLQDKFWGGWSRECLKWRRVRAYLKIGVPMMFTEVLYDWTFEIAIILSGSFGIAAAGATGVLINLIFFFTPLLTGVYIAVAIRVSTLLGERNIVGAKRSIWICVQAGVAVSLLGATLMVLTRHQIPYLYTQDEEVIELVTEFLPLAALDFVLSSFTYVVQGVLEGQGRPHTATLSAVLGTWAIGLSLSFLLAIKLEWELNGLFVGLVVGEASKLLLMILAVVRTDWKKQCDDAIAAAEQEEAFLDEMVGVKDYGTVAGGDSLPPPNVELESDSE